jgi:hypothetical protein
VAGDFPAQGTMPIKYPTEDVAFVPSDILSILRQIQVAENLKHPFLFNKHLRWQVVIDSVQFDQIKVINKCTLVSGKQNFL